MNDSLRKCDDGSYTLYSERVGECYHSTHGALTESSHIFINAGLRSVEDRETIRILEVGLGTGLNALLTALEAEKSHHKIAYVGLEPFPISPLLKNQLNYSELLSGSSAAYFDTIHEVPWKVTVEIHPWITFEKRKEGFQEAALEQERFDLIYFDAFSPEVEPALWTAAIFEKCFRILSSGGRLVTYCAKGAVKRALKSAGFWVENLPGPPGKREITRAVKPAQ